MTLARLLPRLAPLGLALLLACGSDDGTSFVHLEVFEESGQLRALEQVCVELSGPRREGRLDIAELAAETGHVTFSVHDFVADIQAKRGEEVLVAKTYDRAFFGRDGRDALRFTSTGGGKYAVRVSGLGCAAGSAL
jgi:hypothetical protein